MGWRVGRQGFQFRLLFWKIQEQTLPQPKKKKTVHTSANRILEIGTLRFQIKLITGKITIIRLHFSEKLNIVLIKDNIRTASPGVSALETGV